ncbi:hypothetical protein [Nitrosococcus halophilus]|uniref:hypothetical protein n=1 Tax=Nitrosococcus halophilus TaxID=133539 RepID=UPI0012FEB790|nr:hypothetical protein [Nitrosococcus halophilus]
MISQSRTLLWVFHAGSVNAEFCSNPIPSQKALQIKELAVPLSRLERYSRRNLIGEILGLLEAAAAAAVRSLLAVPVGKG